MQLKHGNPVRNHRKNSTGAGDYTVVSTTSGLVYGVQAFNNSTGTIAYVKLYDSTAAPTGASTPEWVGLIPAAVGPSTQAIGGGFNVTFPYGILFDTGVAYALVTGAADNDTNAVTAGAVVLNIQYDS